MRAKLLLPRVAVLMVAALLLLMLAEGSVVRSAVSAGMRLAVEHLIPSLFLFAVVAQFLVRTKLLRPLERFVAPFFQRFLHLPPASASAFLLGAVGGYPLGSQTVAALYATGQLSRREAEATLGFSNNCGIAYVFSVVAPTLGLTAAEAWKLYAIHLVSALVAARLLRGIYRDPPVTAIPNAALPESEPIFSAVTASVGVAAHSMLTLTGFLCLFSVCNALLCLLPIAIPTYVTGVLELSAGIAVLGYGDLAVAAFLIGIGGVCVFCQTAAATTPHKLRLSRHLVGKILQGIISLLGVRLFF